MNCKNCGNEIKSDAQFCTQCGEAVLTSPESNSNTHENISESIPTTQSKTKMTYKTKLVIVGVILALICTILIFKFPGSQYVGDWVDDKDGSWAKVTRNGTSYIWEDSDGKYPATIESGMLAIDSGLGKVYASINSKTGKMELAFLGEKCGTLTRKNTAVMKSSTGKYNVTSTNDTKKEKPATTPVKKQYNHGLDQQIIDATGAGDLVKVKNLIEAGADPNARDPYYGQTPIICGVQPMAFNAPDSKISECIKVLVAAGADVNARSGSESTALMYASHWNYIESVKVLLAAGADVNLRDNRGRTALDEAYGHNEIADLLRQHGAKEGTQKK
ncbi:MAG TPA: ankyrin repeat domain-containing protein [Syntrophomonadaceae bacterium]|nr:ankyrin repeat domain-containing protein [Syntrophomonadaceae bacterium]